LMKALFNGRLTPDADVEGIVKEIIAEVNFKFTASPEESPAPSNLIDRENLRGRIGIDLINNPQEQAVRKQGTELGSSESYRKKEEEKKLRELIEKIRAISAP
ncbi:MAG: hypothetical protein NC821_02455, partial [Candidatus Omnitrophica bacterium]|nr:hypothetical protein [Candidatus Omnitrophota bacterium]